MANDWIPVRENLGTVREVLAISQHTGESIFWVMGALIHFWGWVSRESSDGKIVDVHVDALVDALKLPKNFFDALKRVSWLVHDEASVNTLIVPNFDAWLSRGAKARISKTKRQKTWREGRKNVDAVVDTQTSTRPSTTEQNRTVSTSIDKSIDVHAQKTRSTRTRKASSSTLQEVAPGVYLEPDEDEKIFHALNRKCEEINFPGFTPEVPALFADYSLRKEGSRYKGRKQSDYLCLLRWGISAFLEAILRDRELAAKSQRLNRPNGQVPHYTVPTAHDRNMVSYCMDYAKEDPKLQEWLDENPNAVAWYKATRNKKQDNVIDITQEQVQ